jgi:hypothetical protein
MRSMALSSSANGGFACVMEWLNLDDPGKADRAVD